MPQNPVATVRHSALAIDQLLGMGWYASTMLGTTTSQNYQKVVVLPAGGADIFFSFNNCYNISEGTSYGFTFAVAVALTPTGTPIPVTIGGAATATFVAGVKQTILTDPLRGYTFTPGQTIYVNIFADSTGSGQIPANMPCSAASGDRWMYTAAHGETNQTLNGAYNYTNQTGTQNYMYGFSGIFGKLPTLMPTIACLGDSITAGVGENLPLPGIGNQGWVNRAFNGVLPCSVQGMVGEKASNCNVIANTNIRRMPLNRGSKFINELCINDINAGNTLAQVQAANIANAVFAAQAGAQVWQVTATPQTSGTFTTVAGQTVLASDPVRVAYNAWIRNGAPMTIANNVYTPAVTGSTAAGVVRMRQKGHPMFSYIDVEVICIDAASGKWQAGATTDGTHPTSAYHILIAASVNKTNYPLLFTMAY